MFTLAYLHKHLLTVRKLLIVKNHKVFLVLAWYFYCVVKKVILHIHFRLNCHTRKLGGITELFAAKCIIKTAIKGRPYRIELINSIKKQNVNFN